MNDNANALRSKNAKRVMQKTMQKRNQGRAEEAKRAEQRGVKEASIVSCRSEKRQAPEAHRKTQGAHRSEPKETQGALKERRRIGARGSAGAYRVEIPLSKYIPK